MRLKIHSYFLLLIAIIGFSSSLFGQAVMFPIPAQTGTYNGGSSHIRGFGFTSPKNFKIVGVRVPAGAGLGLQHINVIRINDPAPNFQAFPAVSTNFTSLIYINGAPNGVIQPTNVDVFTGDRIGAVGYAGSNNSYGPTQPTVNFDGFNVVLYRIGSQVYTPGAPIPNYWYENANIALVELWIEDCESYLDTVNVSICEGETYTIGSKTRNTTGVYVDTFKTVDDCDSIIVSNLTVNNVYQFDTIDSTYAGYPYSFLDTQYSVSGYYKHFYKSQAGCDSNYTLTLKVIPVVFDTVYREICQGDSVMIYKKYYKTNTNVLDTIIEDWGHRISRVMVKVNPLPNIIIRSMFGQQEAYCIGDTITLVASGAKLYEWFIWERDSTYKNLIVDSNILSTKVFFEKTTFKVEAMDENSCKNVKEFTLIGENCCEIQVPTAFTPNNDGLNDVFRIIAKAQPQKLIIQIYNRVGHLVYYSNSIHDTWKGVDNKGKELATDTYFYNISGQCWDGTPISIKGDITLLR